MTLDATAVERVLARTDLLGLPVTEGPGGVVLVEDVTARNLLRLWRAARSVMAETGRRPVAVTKDFTEVYDEALGDPDAAELGVLELMAGSGDPWRDGSEPWPVDASELAFRAGTPGGLDLAAEAARELELPVPETVLDRWIYDRVLADPAQRARELEHVRVYATTDYWYEPDEIALALLPATAQWAVPGWASYFGALGEDAWKLSAALEQWELRWGAELVASWGTMLQLVTARRPADGAEAWQLAGELKQVGGSLQMDRWQLALALAEGDAWFLHDRP